MLHAFYSGNEKGHSGIKEVDEGSALGQSCNHQNLLLQYESTSEAIWVHEKEER